MTSEAAREHKEKAHELRRQDAVHAAGDEYVLAAHEYFGHESEHKAIECLVYAIICYRLDECCSEVRSQQVTYCRTVGVESCRLQAKKYRPDVEPTGHYYSVRSGAWHELAGDILVAAGCDDYEDEYQKAEEVYEIAGDLDLSIKESEHISMYNIYRSITLGSGSPCHYDRATEMEYHYNEGTLIDLLTLKRDTLPDCVDQILEQGSWTWDE